MGIETICEGGIGGCAKVYIQLRNIFPGMGGTITTEQDFVVAYRVPLDSNITESKENCDKHYKLNLKTNSSREALNVFLRHTLIKKFDDYFFRKGSYKYAHIPRPLGSTDEGGYIYEWAHGSEGFSSEYFDENYGRIVPVDIDEWNVVAKDFNNVGISIFHDTADAHDGRYTKNLIVQEPGIPVYPRIITKLWKRIDFGSESLPIDFNTLENFIKDSKKDLIRFIKPERVKMIKLIVEYLKNHETPESFKSFYILKQLIKSFRVATASHMGIQGIKSFKELKKCTIKKIFSENTELTKDNSFVRRIKTGKISTIDLEIRSEFKSIDGTIYTLQEIPVARKTILNGNDPEIGFKLFLRHFIAKKLENAFITEGRYSYAHITRPLGSEGSSYWYDWAYGDERCLESLIKRNSPSNKKDGLDQWYEFVCYFAEAGIDFKSKLQYIPYWYNKEIKITKCIIIRQPYSEIENRYISRLWKRINFQECSIPFDTDKLQWYLCKNEDYLRKHMTPERYETVLLAGKYLKDKKISINEATELKNGIHNYRVSALRHLTHYGFGPPPEGFTDLKITVDSS